MIGFASRICCSIGECWPLTAARYCNINLVLSVLPAPDSPLQQTQQCTCCTAAAAAAAIDQYLLWACARPHAATNPPAAVVDWWNRQMDGRMDRHSTILWRLLHTMQTKLIHTCTILMDFFCLARASHCRNNKLLQYWQQMAALLLQTVK